MNYPILFSPIKIGNHKLRNRVVHTATVSGYGANTRPTQRLIDYHRARAAGGAAMIVTELMPVHHTSLANPFLVSVFDENNLDLLKNWSEAVESEDCRLVGQLGHVGRQQLWSPLATPVSASARPDPLSWTVPHKMTIAETEEIIESFINAAERLQRAGFSGAELHGAHGYLLTQYMSPFSNNRNDKYGGTRERRLTFVYEIISGIRETCGSNFLLGLKMPCDEGVPEGITPGEAEQIIKCFIKHDKLDYFAFSQGNFSQSLENHLPDMHFPERPYLNLHAQMRKSTNGIPVMTLGRIESPEAAEEALESGCGDLVGFCRALVSDASWPHKAKHGNTHKIRPCIYCNYCWGEIHAGRGMTCIHNPELATKNEFEWTPPPAKNSKYIVIVGSGVAALEAAWIAAARGHRVELYTSASEPGGGALWESRLPGRKDVRTAIEFQLVMAEHYGVDFNYNRHLTAEEIILMAPDKVILAIVAIVDRPAGLTLDSDAIDIRSASENLLENRSQRSGTAVLFDQDHSSSFYAAAELFAKCFERAIIINPRPTIGSKVNYISLIGVFRRLSELRIKIISLSSPLALTGSRLLYRNILNNDEEYINDISTLTYSTPRISNNLLYSELCEAGIVAETIGDCKAPRNMAAAIHEGHKAGLES